MTNGQWQDAIDNLNNFGDKYGSRRQDEADLLQEMLDRINDPPTPPQPDGNCGGQIFLDPPQQFSAPSTGLHYHAILDLNTNNVVARGSSKDGLALDTPVFLAPNSDFRIFVLDPTTQEWGYTNLATGASGKNLTVASVLLGPAYPFTNPDGLTSMADFILGLDPNTQIVPGMTNLAALQQGLIGSRSLATTTGVVASVPLQGDARAVDLIGSTANTAQETAYVATGSYGLAIVDVSNFQAPVLLGQLALGGTATDVAVDSTLHLAAVADGIGGLQIVNVADPTKPALVQTIPINVTQVQIVDGIAYANNGGALDAFDLATGAELQSLSIGSAAITGLARDGSMLYVMDSSKTLTTVDISSGQMVKDGSITLSQGGGNIFAAGGVVYVPTNDPTSGGYSTVDVSNPFAPKLLQGPDSRAIESGDIALNGSGLGVAVGKDGGGLSGVVAFDVVNTSDPTKTGQFITR
jgi:hypothetical protein